MPHACGAFTMVLAGKTNYYYRNDGVAEMGGRAPRSQTQSGSCRTSKARAYARWASSPWDHHRTVHVAL